MQEEVAKTILKELREFRTEENKRWEVNEKRWEQNEKRWEENEKRWKENEKRWEENEKRWEENEKRWEENEKRLTKLENMTRANTENIKHLRELRENDRDEIKDILDTMSKSISEKFKRIESKLDSIIVRLAENDLEHAEFKQMLASLSIKIPNISLRLSELEKWRKRIDEDLFAV